MGNLGNLCVMATARRTGTETAKQRLERVNRRNESLWRNGERVVTGLRQTANKLRNGSTQRRAGQ